MRHPSNPPVHYETTHRTPPPQIPIKTPNPTHTSPRLPQTIPLLRHTPHYNHHHTPHHEHTHPPPRPIVAAPRRRVHSTPHRRRATMAPSKKGAKTQTQVVHHDEDDLIQVRDRDDAWSVGSDEGTAGWAGWDAIIASSSHLVPNG